MCFDPASGKLAKIIDLGEADLDEVQSFISPKDEQEMCGSYEIDVAMLHWLAQKFHRNDLQGLRLDLFLEREN